MSQWVYLKSEPGLWTVGHYRPEGGFVPSSDHTSEDEAKEHVRLLNGGEDRAGATKILQDVQKANAAFCKELLAALHKMNDTLEGIWEVLRAK